LFRPASAFQDHGEGCLGSVADVARKVDLKVLQMACCSYSLSEWVVIVCSTTCCRLLAHLGWCSGDALPLARAPSEDGRRRCAQPAGRADGRRVVLAARAVRDYVHAAVLGSLLDGVCVQHPRRQCPPQQHVHGRCAFGSAALPRLLPGRASCAALGCYPGRAQRPRVGVPSTWPSCRSSSWLQTAGASSTACRS